MPEEQKIYEEVSLNEKNSVFNSICIRINSAHNITYWMCKQVS